MAADFAFDIAIEIGSPHTVLEDWKMTPRFILTDYMEQALSLAVYDKMEDGSFAGRIPACTGVIAFAPTLRECERELRSVLEDWILLGLKLKHTLPVIAGIDLNEEPKDASLVSDQKRREHFRKYYGIWAGRDLSEFSSIRKDLFHRHR